MLLAIDCGNTNTVFAILDGDRTVASYRMKTDHARTADQYFGWLSTMMNLQGVVAEIDACIISSTVPRVVFNLRVLCDRYFDTRPRVVGRPDCRLPQQPRVDAGTTVGPDRLVNAAAGHDRHGGDLIVVDFGTATTFDVVDTDGAYVGGVIAPGVNLSAQALHAAAARLPKIEIMRPERTIGTNTVTAMQAGVFWGYVALIDGLIDRICQEHGGPMTVVATGGVSSLFQGATTRIDHFDPDLTIRGLTEIARRLGSRHDG